MSAAKVKENNVLIDLPQLELNLISISKDKDGT